MLAKPRIHGFPPVTGAQKPPNCRLILTTVTQLLHFTNSIHRKRPRNLLYMQFYFAFFGLFRRPCKGLGEAKKIAAILSFSEIK
jgi:hypothetical protein